MQTEFVPGIWTVQTQFRLGLIELGGRMTVIQLQEGGLLLHSPVQWSEELEEAVSAQGPVRYIVAPNLFHHLFVGEWAERFPDAKVLAPPGFQEKRSDVRVHDTLSAGLQPDWGPGLQHELLQGAPKWNEVVFYHPSSQTLVVTDLFFYLDQARGLTRLYAGLNGCHAKPRPTLVAKALIKQKDTFSESIARVLEWKPERLILAHGSCVPSDAFPLIAQGLEPWT